MPHKCNGSLKTIYNGMGMRDIALTGRLRNISAGEGITSDRVGLPTGALHPVAWVMPQKAGYISAHNMARGKGSATLALVSGRNVGGVAAGASETTATAKLVVSASAAAAGSSTVSGSLVAVLMLSGSASGSSTATASKNAIAWCAGESFGSSSALLGSFAIGHLSGAIYVNESEASVQQIADSVWSASPESHIEGSAGYALNIMRMITQNKVVADPATGVLTVYDDSGDAVLTANLFKDSAGTDPFDGTTTIRRERLS
jgi:hypothetical protein